MATLINYSHEIGIDQDVRGLDVCLGLTEPRFVYIGEHARLEEIWRDGNNNFDWKPLTLPGGVPRADEIHTFVDTALKKKFVVFLDGAGNLSDSKNVHVIYWSQGGIGTKNLTGEATDVNDVPAPLAKGRRRPVGFYSPFSDGYYVIYLSGAPDEPEGQLQALWWPSLESPVLYIGDKTLAASAPAAVSFTAYAADQYMNIIYISGDGHIRRLFWTTDTEPPRHEDLSVKAQAPPALLQDETPYCFPPSAYYLPHDRTHQIAYLANDGHLWEIYWQDNNPPWSSDLMHNLDGAPQPDDDFVTYYHKDENTQHVIYPHEGRLYEIWWTHGGGEPAYGDLTEVYQLPLAIAGYRNSSLVAFAVEGANEQHVAYISNDQHIYEVIW